MTSYPIGYTKATKLLLGDSLLTFEERLRAELADEDVDDIPSNLIFHVMEYDGNPFIAVGEYSGAAAGTIVVDIATYEDSEELTAWPLKSERFRIPRTGSLQPGKNAQSD